MGVVLSADMPVCAWMIKWRMYKVWEECCAHYRDVTAWKIRVCVYAVLFAQECLCVASVLKCTIVSMRVHVDAHMLVCAYL